MEENIVIGIISIIGAGVYVYIKSRQIAKSNASNQQKLQMSADMMASSGFWAWFWFGFVFIGGGVVALLGSIIGSSLSFAAMGIGSILLGTDSLYGWTQLRKGINLNHNIVATTILVIAVVLMVGGSVAFLLGVQ